MIGFKEVRQKYHKAVCGKLLTYRKKTEVPNIADKSSQISIDFSKRMVAKLGFKLAKKELSPQAIGQQFTELTRMFIDEAFEKLQHVRPGKWIISTSQAGIGIAAFDQYDHLAQLQKILQENPKLKTALGGDYLITPDIIVARSPEPDEIFNKKENLLQRPEPYGSFAPLRKGNFQNSPPILHASISCKWTMRSDRAQNTRTEALNLIRNRKGNTPHIMAVTFEPMPSRLASIALGTGDLDCTYHVALYELLESIRQSGQKDQYEQLNNLIEGRRIRDISDLPLDLAI